MKDGFISVACASCDVSVADTEYNKKQIFAVIDSLNAKKVCLAVLPELCVTGSSCADLFYTQTLISGAYTAICDICDYTKGKYPVFVVGTPLVYCSKIFDCAVVIHDGKILGVIAKTFLANTKSDYQQRYFLSAELIDGDAVITIAGQTVPFGNNIVFSHFFMKNYTFGVEIGEDLYSTTPCCEMLSSGGANIIVNSSAFTETGGVDDKRLLFVKSSSARYICGYAMCNACSNESTQDAVFCAHNIIAECGEIICENSSFESNTVISQIDVDRIAYEKANSSYYIPKKYTRTVTFEQEVIDTELTRDYRPNPFIPLDNGAEHILNIQAYGLKKRLEHIKSKSAVIGISGGLDSTLAILVIVRAMKLCNRPLSDIIAVTMPCFGTSDRTKSNAVLLCEQLGVKLKEINISESVRQHFNDIGHNADELDITYENAQARERTQVLMDVANMYDGIVIGTGDLSELALGWATYNGDHMSMYGVNASVPKTLVRHLVKYEASNYSKKIADILYDIVETPISPELLPMDSCGDISQKTEDLVGPYELHDFFIYYFLRFGFSPAKIYRLALAANGHEYDSATILKWLKIFFRRFFIQQFKRSCIPDGPKATEVSLSPRSDWRMPTDASFKIWMDELDDIE